MCEEEAYPDNDEFLFQDEDEQNVEFEEDDFAGINFPNIEGDGLPPGAFDDSALNNNHHSLPPQSLKHPD